MKSLNCKFGIGLAAAALLVSASFGGIGIFFDPVSAGVTNRVVRIDRSVDSQKYQGASNVLVLMAWSDVLTNEPWARLKVTNNVVEWIGDAEWQTVTNAEAAASAATALAGQQFSERVAKTNALARLDAFLGTWEGRLLRGQLETLIDEINSLRTQQAFLLMELNKAKVNITSWRNEAAFATNGWGNRTLTQARNAIVNKIDAQPDNN